MEEARTRFSYLAWAVLLFTVLVILGGAVVRATGSGDGCGETWPVCSDRIFPVNAGIETTIEFGHRLMSGLAIIGIAVLFLWGRRLYERGDLVRWGTAAAGVLIIIESLIGASLVLFGWVDDDTSIARMVVVPLHLINTMLLVASLTLTAWWASGNAYPRQDIRSTSGRRLLLGGGGFVLVAAVGALNALADTLYPADDFISGVREELAGGAPGLVQARILHPLVAIVVGLAVAYLVTSMAHDATHPTRVLSRIVAGLVIAQFGLGILNVVLATPIETQVIHLAMANAIWISYVLFAGSLLGEPVRVEPLAASQQ